jgi:cell division septation protein DedD
VAGEAAPSGHYHLQLGAVRSRGEAEAMSQAIKSQHPAAANRTISVNEASYGNMGQFYRVGIGPFASPQESQSLCARIRNSGIDCMVVTR